MYHRILVPLDRSEIRNSVMQEAIALAKATGASLHLLHVLSYEDEHAPGLKEKGTEEYQRRWQTFEQNGKDLLQAALTEAIEAGVPTVHTLMSGKPGRAICNLASSWEADLILLGRRQIRGIQELIMGSVSNYVVHSAPCSVFIVQGALAEEYTAA